jgi:hypothetical protein
MNAVKEQFIIDHITDGTMRQLSHRKPRAAWTAFSTPTALLRAGRRPR